MEISEVFLLPSIVSNSLFATPRDLTVGCFVRGCTFHITLRLHQLTFACLQRTDPSRFPRQVFHAFSPCRPLTGDLAVRVMLGHSPHANDAKGVLVISSKLASIILILVARARGKPSILRTSIALVLVPKKRISWRCVPDGIIYTRMSFSS